MSTGSRFDTAPDWGDESTGIVALDGDVFVAFGGFGELTMIEHGQSVATANLLPESYTQPHEVTVHAVPLDHDTLARVVWPAGRLDVLEAEVRELRARMETLESDR